MVRVALFALAFSLMGLAVMAGARAQVPAFSPVTLTEASASQAIAAMPGVYDVARSYEDMPAPSGGDDVLAALSGLGTYAAAKAELDAAVGAFGFAGYEAWAQTIQSVLHAYVHIRTAGAMQQMAPAMDAAIQQIISNPNISQAQKDAIIAQMGGSQSAMVGLAANAPSPANRAVVEAIMPQIEEMIAYLEASGR